MEHVLTQFTSPYTFQRTKGPSITCDNLQHQMSAQIAMTDIIGSVRGMVIIHVSSIENVVISRSHPLNDLIMEPGSDLFCAMFCPWGWFVESRPPSPMGT